MPKKLKLSDTLVSLYGVPFDEALAGVLAVKPPENGEGTRDEKKTAGKKSRPSTGKRKK